MVSEKLKMEVTPIYDKIRRDSTYDYNEDSDMFYIYNETSLLEERNLVKNWRLALEGILIPCIGLPGIVGKKYFIRKSIPMLCPLESCEQK